MPCAMKDYLDIQSRAMVARDLQPDDHYQIIETFYIFLKNWFPDDKRVRAQQAAAGMSPLASNYKEMYDRK